MKRLTKTNGGCFKYSDGPVRAWGCDYRDATGKRSRKLGFHTKYEASQWRAENHRAPGSRNRIVEERNCVSNSWMDSTE